MCEESKSIKCLQSFHAKKPSLASGGSHIQEMVLVWFILGLNFFFNYDFILKGCRK